MYVRDSLVSIVFAFSVSLCAVANADTLRVACVGDSITAGARVDAATESYPARLQEILGEQYTIENFGLGGATLLKSGRPNVWQKLEEVKKFNPHLVVISLGTNDTVAGQRRNWEKIDQFDRDYTALIDQLASLPAKPRIILCTPTSMVLSTHDLSSERLVNLKERKPRLQQLCARVRSLAKTHASKNVSLLELNAVLAERPDLLTEKDGVHPNAAGYLEIANAVARHIREGDERPNIVLVMADDQGWGDVGYNGHPFVQTPELDAMAQEALVLDRFYAAAPVCSPTRASVMTGRNPIRTKVTNHGRYMRPHEYTIAESLKAAGYATGIFGKVHLGAGQPDSPCNPTGMGFDDWVVGLNFFDNDPYLSRNGVIEHRAGKGSVLAMDDALAFLRKNRGSGKPIFMVVWFPSPHDPHQEVPDGPRLYEGKKMAGYYREITLLDQQLGRLRRELRDMEMAENTILWYCSDNGGLNEATSGGRERKGSVYEGGLRIPGIIEWPRRQLSGQTSVPVWTCDIFPTVLAMAGVELDSPHPLDGIDASKIIAGEVRRRAKPMGFWHKFQQGQSTWSDRILKAIMEKQQAGVPTPHNALRMRKDVDEFPQFAENTTTGHAAWNDWPWKLHRIDGTNYELYNLADDPMEQNDLSTDGNHRARMQAMKQELSTWMQSVVRSLNGADYETQ